MKIHPVIFLMLPLTICPPLIKTFQPDAHINADRYNPGAYDIVINEVMADPEPVVNLPSVEYIELYNKTDDEIEMVEWSLTVGEKSIILPDIRIGKHDFLLICDAGDSSWLKPYGSVLPVKGLPALPNKAGILTLTAHPGEVIHSVYYSNRWFSNALKAEGGWSLELKDPDNPCGGLDNWDGSDHYLGGTPGFTNSLACLNPDDIKPDLYRAATTSDSGLLITFNEPMMFSGVSDPFLYTVNREIYHPLTAEPVPPDYHSVNLTFNDKFKPFTVYELMVKEEINDCAGNSLAKRYAEFGLALNPDSFDLIINEVLFDALDEEEFVEVMNRSEKILELSSLKFLLMDGYTGSILKMLAEISGNFQLLPGHYAVVTRNATMLKDHYHCSYPAAIIEDPEMGALPDREGRIALADKTFKVIDQFTYNAAYHHGMIKDPEGVSLERLHRDFPTNDPDNWHSAAEDAGFATPGYENSQSFSPDETFQASVRVIPEIFTPDNDGKDDFLALAYQFDNPGIIASVMIFDNQGRLVKQLAKNALLGIEGFFTWDGTDDEGKPEKAGIYLVYTEVFSAKGGLHQYKNICVLARELK